MSNGAAQLIRGATGRERHDERDGLAGKVLGQCAQGQGGYQTGRKGRAAIRQAAANKRVEIRCMVVSSDSIGP